MRPGSVLSGLPFRTALLVLLVVGPVLTIGGWLVYAKSQGALYDQLQSDILEDFQLFSEASDADGEAGLAKFVDAATATRSDRKVVFGLFDAEGRHLAGNIAIPRVVIGWQIVTETTSGTKDNYLEVAGSIRGDLVIIGQSTRAMEANGQAILEALSFAGLIIFAASVVIGYTLTRGVSRKLNVMAGTLDEVSRGNTKARLPVGRSNDQIDHLARQMNAHLDRLSELMGSMRNTAVAIAHDLKSPLNRVSVLLQEASRVGDPEEVRLALSRAEEEMDSLKSLLDTVLRISRIQSLGDISTFETFSAEDLASDLVQTFEPVVVAAGQTLVYAPAEKPVPILGDRRMVQQMLVNLIENAIRYAGGGATIALSTAVDDARTRFVVGDNGPGIPANQREKVFEPFHRLAPDRGGSGAGLGLAMVKAIVVRHQATIVIEDNRPGARITVTFPRRQKPAQSSLVNS